MKLFSLVLSAGIISGASAVSVVAQAANSNVVFQRPDKGTPITTQEREAATDEFLTILKDTRYYGFAESRIHGTPEGNPQGHYWWGSMWTGVQVSKVAGQVAFTHQNNGSDNVGIHTAPYLEGACYAYRLTGDRRYEKLAQKLIRGFSSWILSSSRSATDAPKILSRSFYPSSFESFEDGRALKVNYEASRPGVATEASDYVHVAQNPYFGDLWVKNNRSIDDIGQMIRAMSQIQVCHNIFSKETQIDLEEMNHLYANWAKSVEDAQFVIPGFNKQAEIVVKKNGIGDYDAFGKFLGFNPNCAGKMAIHFLYDSQSRGFNCGNGLSILERVLNRYLSNDVIEILRSHHISSIAMAELRGQKDIALKLRQGLATRIENDLGFARNPASRPKLDTQDIPAEFVHANNVGVPLTSNEIRFLYERLHQAYEGMRQPQFYSTFHLFDSTVPDGQYNYDAPSTGLYFYTLAPMVGACASTWVQSSVRPLLNCERVAAALKNEAMFN